MRGRKRILDDLERAYREAFQRAEAAGDDRRMSDLDFDFQRDQLWFEVALDLRDLLAGAPERDEDDGSPGLLEKAKALRDLTRGR